MTSARRTALKHADTVVEGAIVQAFSDGEPHWVVFSGGTPVASYPAVSGTLSALVADVDLAKKMTPDQFRARRADQPACGLALWSVPMVAATSTTRSDD